MPWGALRVLSNVIVSVARLRVTEATSSSALLPLFLAMEWLSWELSLEKCSTLADPRVVRIPLLNV